MNTAKLLDSGSAYGEALNGWGLCEDEILDRKSTRLNSSH